MALVEGGNMRLEILDDSVTSKVTSILTLARECGSISSALNQAGELRRPPTRSPATPGSGEGSAESNSLTVFYTDFEPDDVLAVAQLWQWKAQVGELASDPLIVFCADLATKDGGTVFEKKELLASLALGAANWHILTYAGDEGNSKFFDGSVHPKAKALADARTVQLAAICKKLAAFDGKQIDLHIMAPGHGNLGQIYDHLRVYFKWPLRTKWKVSMYTGSFNTRGMNDNDLKAMEEIMQCSDSPMLDMSKFPFFGGKDCSEVTASLGTFSLPSFTKKLCEAEPLLAAAWKSFNQEFNEGLIHPDNKGMFKTSPLDADESKRLAALREIFIAEGVEAYCKALRADEGVYAKVVHYKKNTIMAFANGKLDSPICDQLLFLVEWLMKNHPDWLEPMVEGMWCLDREKGFTRVDSASSGGIRAIQPVLKNPRDEQSLLEMRMATEDYVFRHLRTLRKEPLPEAPEAAQGFLVARLMSVLCCSSRYKPRVGPAG